MVLLACRLDRDRHPAFRSPPGSRPGSAARGQQFRHERDRESTRGRSHECPYTPGPAARRPHRPTLRRAVGAGARPDRATPVGAPQARARRRFFGTIAGTLIGASLTLALVVGVAAPAGAVPPP